MGKFLEFCKIIGRICFLCLKRLSQKTKDLRLYKMTADNESNAERLEVTPNDETHSILIVLTKCQ